MSNERIPDTPLPGPIAWTKVNNYIIETESTFEIGAGGEERPVVITWVHQSPSGDCADELRCEATFSRAVVQHNGAVTRAREGRYDPPTRKENDAFINWMKKHDVTASGATPSMLVSGVKYAMRLTGWRLIAPGEADELVQKASFEADMRMAAEDRVVELEQQKRVAELEADEEW